MAIKENEFEEIDVDTTSRIADTITTAVRDPKQWEKKPASPEEAEARRELLQTQGKKGCKAKRLCMTITPTNHQFVATVAAALHKTQSQVINDVLAKYREEHAEEYKNALEVIAKIEEGFGGKEG